MKFKLNPQSRVETERGAGRRFALFLNVAIVLILTLSANCALAEKLKLAVFPVNTTMNIQAAQKEYLYDAIREAASASAGSYVGILPKQKIKGLLKKKKGGCDEECALNGASTVGARIAIVVELDQKDSQVVGVVKLLDAQEEVLLTVKRFFSASTDGAEQELQSAVMFVLSAQFLPLNDTDKAALQAEQQNIPATFAHSDGADQELYTSPSTPVQPQPAAENANQNDYSYSNTVIAQPEEPVNPKAYLVTAIVTGVVGVGLGIGAIVAGVQLGKEIKKRDDQTFLRDQLYTDYKFVSENADDAGLVESFNRRWAFLEIQFGEINEYNLAIDGYTENIKLTNDAIKQNGIMAGVFGGLALASLTVSTVFAIKYAKARKTGGTHAALRAPEIIVAPVLSREMNGAVFAASF